MNEQLQKELLDILRSLKDGASPAWQVLVEQRSAYYGVSALLMFMAAALFACVAVLGARYAHNSDGGDAQFAGGMAAAASSLLAIVFLAVAIHDLPTYFAPLGQVLGMVVR